MHSEIVGIVEFVAITQQPIFSMKGYISDEYKARLRSHPSILKYPLGEENNETSKSPMRGRNVRTDDLPLIDF